MYDIPTLVYLVFFSSSNRIWADNQLEEGGHFEETWRGLDVIGDDLEVFGAFSQVLKLWSTFGMPKSILEGLE